MHAADFFFLFAFAAFVIYSGWSYHKVAGESLEQYFLAGRSLKGWQAGLSMAASQFSADTPLLVTGMVAFGGIFSLWRLWIYALSFLMIGFLLAGCWRRANVLTDAELVEKRYGGRMAIFLRGFKAFYLGTVFNIVVLSMVLLAASRVVEPFLTWHLWLPSSVYEVALGFVKFIGVPLTLTLSPDDPNIWINTADNLISLMLIGLLTLIYSTAGGLRSVVQTDAVQFIIMMVGTALFAILIVQHVGGIPTMLDKLSIIFNDQAPMTLSQLMDFTPSYAKDATMAILMVFAVQWIAQINADGSGYLAQRFMACQNATEGRKAAIIFTFAQIFLRSLLWMPIVLGLLVLFPPDFSLDPEHFVASREATYVQGMADILPPGMKGMILTAMMAALASTVDTHLNWGASYWTNDLYRRFWCESILKKEPNPRTLVWVARLSNVCILITAFFIMTRLTSIKSAWETSLLLGAGMGIPLVLRWIWWRFNVWGEISALAVSLIALPFLFVYLPGPENDGWRLLTLVILSLVCSIASAFVFKPEPMEKLTAFYEQVHPPGFWGPVAHRITGGAEKHHVSKQQFIKGTIQTVLTAVSIFCLLVGFGSWVFHSPVPKEWPWPQFWVPALILVGVALIPVWLRPVLATEQDAEQQTKAIALERCTPE